MKLVLVLALSLAACPMGADAQDGRPFVPLSRRRAYDRAYRRGVERAAEDLLGCRATIYTYGAMGSFEFMDRATGLPYEAIAGCTVNADLKAFAEGHNDKIRDEIKASGAPDYAFRRWDRELYDLRGFFEGRSRTDRPQRLSAGGPAVMSASGDVTVRTVMTPYTSGDGSRGQSLAVVVGSRGRDAKPGSLFWTDGDVDLIWGPEGSHFAVIRSGSGGGAIGYMALDLRRGQVLRREQHDPPR